MMKVHARTRISTAIVVAHLPASLYVLFALLQAKLSAIGGPIWVLALFLLIAGMAGPVLSAARHMIYHDEPTMIAVAAAELHGQPLYHGADAGERYSLLYGPVAYWVYQPLMLAGATDLRIYQFWVCVPLLLAGLIMVRIARRAGDLLGAALALLSYALAVLMNASSEWAMKGDAWMLLFFGLELEAALVLPESAAIGLAALCGAHRRAHVFLAAVILSQCLLSAKYLRSDVLGHWRGNPSFPLLLVTPSPRI